MKIRYFLSLFFLFISILPITAQYYETGQDPSFIKWKQIKSEHFKIIFPENYDVRALKYASEFEKAYAKISENYQVKKIKIPVVLHSYSIESNGYVSWAPKRIEIYPLPDQNSLPMDDVEQMTLHELDHVFEIASLNRGLSKGISYILGEQSTGALSAYLPLWFLEGDAVYTETVFSGSGRGNNPSFLKSIKALTLDDSGIFKYDKMINGSFRDFIPDHYKSGYLMVEWSKNRFGSDIWNKALDYTARNPMLLNPVNLSLRIDAGTTKRKIFDSAFEELLQEWKKEEENKLFIEYDAMNKERKGEFTNYYSPVFIGPDSIIAIKTSLYKPTSFVLITGSGEEKQFHIPGTMNPDNFSFGSGSLVWAEYRNDPRWANRGYSIIKILDLQKNRTRQLTHRSRLVNPTVSSDGELIAAVESTPEFKNQLVILKSDNGEQILTIPTPGNIFPQRLQWSHDNKSITLISLSDKGEGILEYNYESGVWETLIAPSGNDLQSAFLRNDSLFWVSSSSGTDNIYLQTPEKKTFKLTSSRFGAYDINLSNSSLVFTDYTSEGYNICSLSLKNQIFKEIKDIDYNAPESVSVKGGEAFTADNQGKEIPAISPYNKTVNLFRLHSWMPFYADPEEVGSDPLSVKPGFTLLSQNLLSTMTATLGYEYNNKQHFLHTNVKWNGWYPVIETSLNWGGEPDIVKGQSRAAVPSALHQGQNFSTEISVPLLFSGGNWIQQVRTAFSASYNNKYIFLPETRTYDYGQVRLTGRVYFANYSKSAIRDIYPRFGQVIDFSYSLTPFDKDIYGPVNTLKSAVFIPGFFRNHGIRIRLEKEIQKPELFVMHNRASFPRGYKNIISEDLGYFSADYAMPLLYPDFNIGSLLYIKRFRSNIFYDYAVASDNSHLTSGIYHEGREVFSSAGIELLSDFYLMRIPFMISAGVQSSYMDLTNSFSWKLLLNIDILGLQINRSKL